MQDDFADLAAFAILCDSGSFTRAAERLGCSKGQLSKRIRALEVRLETRLLHRTTRRLAPTPAGRALLPEAQALVRQRERALQGVARLQEEAAGPVRLTVPVSLGYTFFEVLLACRAAHPAAVSGTPLPGRVAQANAGGGRSPERLVRAQSAAVGGVGVGGCACTSP